MVPSPQNSNLEAEKALVEDYLIGVARRKGKVVTVTYQEMLKDLALSYRPNSSQVRALLNAASENSEARGQGLLSAVVINKKKKRPSDPFFDLAAKKGRDVTDWQNAWETELARVRAAYSGGS